MLSLWRVEFENRWPKHCIHELCKRQNWFKWLFSYKGWHIIMLPMHILSIKTQWQYTSNNVKGLWFWQTKPCKTASTKLRLNQLIMNQPVSTCGQMNPAPYMMLLASGGSTSGGIRCSANIMVKLFKKANMNTWKKFIMTKSWKSLFVRICHIKILNMVKETDDFWEACSSTHIASSSDPLLSKRLSL